MAPYLANISKSDMESRDMKQIAFRLKPGQFLKEEIENLAEEKQIEAGVLLSVVGALDNAVLRMAGSTVDNQTVNKWNEPFEIVSGTGTISKNGCHIHVSLSNKEGKVVGGHLKDGCKIWPTAEIVIGLLDNLKFDRAFDEETGFKELNIASLK